LRRQERERSIVTPVLPTTVSFAEWVSRLHADLTRDGVSVADVRRSPALEFQFAGANELGRAIATGVGVEPIEGPIAARMVPIISPRESKLRYFLDGAQRTFAVWRCGVVPAAATVVAVGILERDPGESGAIAPGTLRLEHCFLIPNVADARVSEVRRRIEAMGMSIFDTLAGADDGLESDDVMDYGHLHELAYVAARKVREQAEARVLTEWVRRPEWLRGEDWIVVDGRLRTPHPRTLGLVKQFSDAYLSGAEAETLLGLPPGHRTTAFHPKDDRRRGGRDPEARTLWYIRLWDAAGMDARHALVRVEAPSSVSTTDEIDRISSWILAERTPRATGDSRWATLLYPVHLLERMLKRRLDADTRGWPGA
jgi:hypothetical protein